MAAQFSINGKNMLVECPARFDDIYAASFLNKLFLQADEQELIIDFQPVNFVCPYATLLIATGIRTVVKKRGLNSLKTTALGLKAAACSINKSELR